MPQRRTPLSDYIPQPADPTLPQSQPALGPKQYAENVSIGIGQGVRDQLAGLLRSAQNPKETLQAIYGLATSPDQWPAMAKDAAVEAYQRATSGPLGLGAVIGANLGPRRIPEAPRTMSVMDHIQPKPGDTLVNHAQRKVNAAVASGDPALIAAAKAEYDRVAQLPPAFAAPYKTTAVTPDKDGVIFGDAEWERSNGPGAPRTEKDKARMLKQINDK